jgi:hypothetical protein
MGAGKSWVVRMGLRVIPGDFVSPMPQLIRIVFNHDRPFVKRQALFEDDPVRLREGDLTL